MFELEKQLRRRVLADEATRLLLALALAQRQGSPSSLLLINFQER